MNLFRYSLILIFLLLVSCSLAPAETTIPSTPTLAPTEITVTQTSTLDIGSTMVSDRDGMKLVFVPAGEFIMGSEVRDDEMPVHKVGLDAFWIDQTEVTNVMYAKCVADGACEEPTSKKSRTHSDYYDNPEFENYPVIYVEWNMAKAYCEWADRRLPTEAEWEKAARGDDGRTYPWGNESPNENLLNFAENIGDTTEVGAYPNGGSVYGALDMAGNVWEWVGSLYQPYPYDPEDGREELDTKRGIVYRGGSWLASDDVTRSANRADFGPTGYSLNDIGFRCAASGTP
jgi:formylglycine-generating enzyme required for sulfatase activity